jgi:cytochrome c-type biogenesis protein CcsB
MWASSVIVAKLRAVSRAWAWKTFILATLLQGVVVGMMFYQVSKNDNLVARVPERYVQAFGPWLAEKSNSDVPADRQPEMASRWLNQQAAGLRISAKSNPVEFGASIGLFVALLMTWLISRRRSVVEGSLPSIDRLDSLLYRTVGVAFPLLSLLLITGAVWANESWGRYWGWDSKEVGALVSWMAYAGYLHTRIAHGWRGRRSAYFALLGFVLVVFTWLGVSYLLPGLHSYAE